MCHEGLTIDGNCILHDKTILNLHCRILRILQYVNDSSNYNNGSVAGRELGDIS